MWRMLHGLSSVSQNIVMDLNNVMFKSFSLEGWLKSKASIQEYRIEIQNSY